MIDPETGDLMVRSGALVVGDTTAQTAEAVLQAMRGEFKEFPLLGAETLKMLGGTINRRGQQIQKRCCRCADCPCRMSKSKTD